MTVSRDKELLPRERIRIQSEVRDLALRMPTIGEIFPLLIGLPQRTHARMAVLGPAEIKRMLRNDDDSAIDIELARAIHGDRAAFAQYVRMRNRSLELLVES